MTTKRYSLSLTREQLLHITNCVEGCFVDHLDADESAMHDKLLDRLIRSVGRAYTDDFDNC